eukprot:365633-Chlamydomonas_euryale.AAC.8
MKEVVAHGEGFPASVTFHVDSTERQRGELAVCFDSIACRRVQSVGEAWQRPPAPHGGTYGELVLAAKLNPKP